MCVFPAFVGIWWHFGPFGLIWGAFCLIFCTILGNLHEGSLGPAVNYTSLNSSTEKPEFGIANDDGYIKNLSCARGLTETYHINQQVPNNWSKICRIFMLLLFSTVFIQYKDQSLLNQQFPRLFNLDL